MREPRRRAAWLIAVLAGLAVYVVSTQVFPYHSTNHDEAVYLQQAAMLLEGQLFLQPPVEDAFRPWFFVDDGSRLYPKYAPVPAAMFALGQALGATRVALAATGTAIVALAYGTVAEAFDRRTAVVAAAFMAASPLFLIDTALFLPYAPTAAWNLLFAYAYLRADRTGSRGWAAIAGAAIGIAFFARPYTAVLFAAPFILHALWVSRSLERAPTLRNAIVALAGIVGVLFTLGYNAAVTGSPFLFPYSAFAPADGLGFGPRAILGYERDYTPLLAVRANALVLREFVTEWFAAGLLGTGLAAVGIGGFLGRARRGFDLRRSVIAGLFLSVVVGNLYFWGNLNVLGDLADPNDGLIHYLGPYYHYDLLLPTAAFAASGSLALVDCWRTFVRERWVDRRSWAAGAGIAFATLVLSAAAVGAAGVPMQEARDVSEQLEAAYQPVDERDLDGALVFLPTPYGDWLNHPFQALRNDPDFDGDVVYALKENRFAVVDAYPDRSLYRYTYRGFWAPSSGTAVDARLQPVRHVSGQRVELRAQVGLPTGVEAVSVRLAGDGSNAYYAANATASPLDFELLVENGTASLSGPLQPQGGAAVPIGDREVLLTELFVDFGGTGAFTYRFELPVQRQDGRVRALTPYVEVCTVPEQCGGEAAYIPNATRPGVSVETDLVADPRGESP